MRSIIFLLVLANSLNVFSQKISGMVQDGSGRAVVAATVALNTSDSLIVAHAVTDDKGAFVIAANVAGRYRLSVSAVGFLPSKTEWLNISLLPLELPTLILQEAPGTLAEMMVVGKKPVIEMQPDKTVFNVENSINATGSSVMEALQKAPGVVIDKDDNILLNGKNGVRIYLDGKPSPLSGTDLATYLRSLPSADIEAIEIITNPSARYEAAGSAGIINLRLKKNKSYGANLLLNAGWSIARFAKYTASLNVNYRKKDLNIFGSYSYLESANYSYLNFYRLQGDSIYDQRSLNNYNTKSHSGRAGADWFIGNRQTLGVLFTGNSSFTDSKSFSRTPIFAQSDKILNRVLSANTSSNRQRANVTGNINYRFTISKSKTLNADADYGYYKMNGNAFIPNLYTDKNGQALSESVFGNTTPVSISLFSLKADYEQGLAGGKLAAGFKTSIVNTDNRFDFFNYSNNVYLPDLLRSNRFTYSEQIHAGYALYQKQSGKLSYQAGIRLEQTISRGLLQSKNMITNNDVKRAYLDVFPSGGITWQAQKNHSIGASFSSRIDRPSYQDLNPFESRLDELTYQKGNPFLRPQYTSSFEIRHAYKNKLNSSLNYSDIRDLFASLTDTIETSRNYITQRNLAHQGVLTATISYPFTLSSWWTVYINASAGYNHYQAAFEQGKNIDLKTLVANICQQQSFTISKKMAGEISGFYQSPSVWGGSYKCRSMWSLDAGISYKLLNDNATLKVSGTDLFYTMPWSGISRFGGLVMKGGGGWESRHLKVNLTYRFGNKQVKATRQRNTGIEELNKRIQ